MTVRIVTDSTADLSPQTLKELDIAVVPQLVLFGHDSYRDGVDLSSEEFFERLTTSRAVPTTSQAPVGAFLEVYEAVAADADAIVAIHLGAKFSGAFASALMARDALRGSCEVEVIDSRGASLGLGFAAVAAAREAKRGASMSEIVGAAKSVARRHHTFAMLDTLEYARRGGRISRIEAMLGGMLNIKPILGVTEEIRALSRARTRMGGLRRMFDLAMAYEAIEQVGVMYATTPEDAKMLAEWVGEQSPAVPIEIARIGPALGAHGGPGIMGMTVVEAKKPLERV